MPRTPRKNSSLDIYHIVIKGLNSQLLFEESNDYRKYLEIIEINNDNLVDTGLVLSEFNSIDDFIEFHSSSSDRDFIDIHNIKHRIPDDVATEVIKQYCKVNYPTDISNFSLIERRNALFS